MFLLSYIIAGLNVYMILNVQTWVHSFPREKKMCLCNDYLGHLSQRRLTFCDKDWENHILELGVPFEGELSQVLTAQTINRKLQPDSHSSLKVVDLSLKPWGLQR